MFGNESERRSARNPLESRGGGVFLTDQGRFAAPGRIACSGLVDPCLALDRDGKSAQAMRQRDPIPNEKALKGRLRNGGICWDCGRMHCRKCFERKVEDGIRCQGSKKTTCYKFATIRAEECSKSDFEAFKADDPLSKHLIKALDQVAPPPPNANKKRRADENGGDTASGQVAESTKMPPAYLPGGGMVEFPDALMEFLSVVAADVDVGGATVEEVLHNLFKLEEVDEGKVCFYCNAAIDLIAFINTEPYSNIQEACATCVYVHEFFRCRRDPKRVGSKEDLKLLVEAAQDAGILKEKLKAPPKLDAILGMDAEYNYDDPYFQNLMDVFDDGGKVNVISGEPCPIKSSSRGIAMDDLVEEVMRMGDSKEDYNEDLMKYLPKNQKEALAKELRKGDGASPSKLMNKTKIAAKNMLKRCFDAKDALYETLHLPEDSPAMKFFRDNYAFSSDYNGRGLKMACHLDVLKVHTATAVFVGGEGAVTKFHGDVTEVINGLWAVDVDGQGVDKSKHFASWVLIHPRGLVPAELHLRKLCPGFISFKDSGDVPLTLDTMVKLIDLVRLHPRTRAPLVILVHQKHGDVHRFPAGYFHIVFTHGPCVKFAIDIFNLEKRRQLKRYICVSRLMSRTFPQGGPAADYMTPLKFVLRSMRRYKEITSGRRVDEVFESYAKKKSNLNE